MTDTLGVPLAWPRATQRPADPKADPRPISSESGPLGPSTVREGPFPVDLPDGLQQRCERCGTEEFAGTFCSWCKGEEYVLVYHRHGQHTGCTLGPYLNPSYRGSRMPFEIERLAADLAAWRASPAAAEAESYVVLRWRHPARQAVVSRPRKRSW